MMDPEFARLSRAQRDAYFRWQKAPAGEQSRRALDAYREATTAQRDYETVMRKRRTDKDSA